MKSISIANGGGQQVTVAKSKLGKFADSFSGELIYPDDAAYNESRAIWNGMIDRKPSLIARCKSASDIKVAVNFARENELLTSIRGAGHNIAGNAVCDNGLMIDLSTMRMVQVDKDARLATVEPGATLGDFDRAAQKYGLATPLGINSTTGISGLTLGGGFGWLTRKYGLTIDYLKSAEVVTADGNVLQASEGENPDLFWAIRGGGGNFGIVTKFEFSLVQVGPDVYSGLIVYPLEKAETVLNQYREKLTALTNDTSVWPVIRKAPPLPFLPESAHGKEVIVLVCFHVGNPEDGEKAIKPFREFGDAVGEHLGVQPYADWQTAFDPLLAPGARNYWKSHNMDKLEDGFFKTVVKYGWELPSDHCEILFANIGGRAAEIPLEATAYPNRKANFVFNIHGRWENKSEDDKCVSWTRNLFQDVAPFANGSVYVNFLSRDDTDRVKAAYGPNYSRLQEAKKKYDPDNFFRLNQNIPPA